MNIDAYLQRIGIHRVQGPLVETLVRVHRAHLHAISYENLDVQLGRVVDLDPARIFRKLVEQRRGGWCYEMNGLLGWALNALGFEVIRANGGVLRSTRGDDAIGNHVVLLVRAENSAEQWLADVGFGDGLIEPVPLREGTIDQHGFRFALEQRTDGFWRFHNHAHGGAMSFDFRPEPGDEELFHRQCTWLQTSAESGFVQNLVVQRVVDGGFEVQRGRVATRISPRGTQGRVLGSAEELAARLRDTFALDVPEVLDLWPKVAARHAELFGDEPVPP